MLFQDLVSLKARQDAAKAVVVCSRVFVVSEVERAIRVDSCVVVA